MFLPTSTSVPTATCKVTLSGQAITAFNTIASRHRQVLSLLNDARAEAYRALELPFSTTVETLPETPWLPEATVQSINWENAYKWQNAYNRTLFEGTDWNEAQVSVADGRQRRQFRFYTSSVTQRGNALFFPFEDTTVRVDAASELVLSDYDYISFQIEHRPNRGPLPKAMLIREDPIQRSYAHPSDGLPDNGFDEAIRRADDSSRLHAINAAVEQRGLGGAKRASLARYLTETADTVRLSTDSDALLTHRIASTLADHVAHIPQRGDIVMSRTPLPDAFDQWAAAFPQKQHLTDDEQTLFYATLHNEEVGQQMGQENDPYLYGRALPAIMHEEGVLTDTDVQNYALCPWQPWDRDSVLNAVAVGEQTRNALQETAAERGITFPNSLLTRLDDDAIPIHWSLT